MKLHYIKVMFSFSLGYLHKSYFVLIDQFHIMFSVPFYGLLSVAVSFMIAEIPGPMSQVGQIDIVHFIIFKV